MAASSALKPRLFYSVIISFAFTLQFTLICVPIVVSSAGVDVMDVAV